MNPGILGCGDKIAPRIAQMIRYILVNEALRQDMDLNCLREVQTPPNLLATVAHLAQILRNRSYPSVSVVMQSWLRPVELAENTGKEASHRRMIHHQAHIQQMKH